jgi:predicted RNase H-like nuclease (RuvC/YqgF family)
LEEKVKTLESKISFYEGEIRLLENNHFSLKSSKEDMEKSKSVEIDELKEKVENLENDN